MIRSVGREPGRVTCRDLAATIKKIGASCPRESKRKAIDEVS